MTARPVKRKSGRSASTCRTYSFFEVDAALHRRLIERIGGDQQRLFVELDRVGAVDCSRLDWRVVGEIPERVATYKHFFPTRDQRST